MEIEKELIELNNLENELSSTNNSPKKEEPQKIKKQTKLSYKDQREYDKLPQEIEELEKNIEDLNSCLMDPKCYEQKGIVAVSKELEEIEAIYEQKVEKYLELEELVESFKN